MYDIGGVDVGGLGSENVAGETSKTSLLEVRNKSVSTLRLINTSKALIWILQRTIKGQDLILTF